MITVIAARAGDGAIGKEGRVPWTAPEDMRFFRRETTQGAVIMGRRTWESLPARPLGNRLNIVVTRGAAEGAEVVARDVGEAVAAAAGYARIYGIGGSGIYEALLPSADRLLLTEVAVEVPGADTFFPAFDAAEWREACSIVLREQAPRCVAREFFRRG